MKNNSRLTYAWLVFSACQRVGIVSILSCVSNFGNASSTINANVVRTIMVMVVLRLRARETSEPEMLLQQ